MIVAYSLVTRVYNEGEKKIIIITEWIYMKYT